MEIAEPIDPFGIYWTRDFICVVWYRLQPEFGENLEDKFF